jgi:Glycosyl hydrolases family 43
MLDPHSWIKQPEPVFQRSIEELGTGHCSFVKSPDGREDWIVYHAHVGPGTGQRDIRIRRFTWNADGSPDFGIPVSRGVPLPRPSGECKPLSQTLAEMDGEGRWNSKAAQQANVRQRLSAKRSGTKTNTIKPLRHVGSGEIGPVKRKGSGGIIGV